MNLKLTKRYTQKTNPYYKHYWEKKRIRKTQFHLFKLFEFDKNLDIDLGGVGVILPLLVDYHVLNLLGIMYDYIHTIQHFFNAILSIS